MSNWSEKNPSVNQLKIFQDGTIFPVNLAGSVNVGYFRRIEIFAQCLPTDVQLIKSPHKSESAKFVLSCEKKINVEVSRNHIYFSGIDSVFLVERVEWQGCDSENESFAQPGQ